MKVSTILRSWNKRCQLERFWWKAYKAARTANNFPTARQASNIADIETAGKFGFPVDDIEILKDAGLDIGFEFMRIRK